MVALREALAIAETASKSPIDAIGKPASMTSTPIVSSRSATSSLSSKVMVAPGHCSPSRSVVSKMIRGVVEACVEVVSDGAVSRVMVLSLDLEGVLCERDPLSAQAHRPAGPQGRLRRPRRVRSGRARS